MPFCPDCGTEVSEDTRFCPECGRPFMVIGQAVNGENRKKRVGIIVACVIAIIVIIALFSIKPWERTYTLSVIANPLGAGWVSPSGGEYESGAQVTLIANPASGYAFDHWSGSASGTTSTITVTMDSDATLTAHFETTPTVPEVLFSDDFSDETGVWDTFSDENGSVSYRNGWLHLTNYTSATVATYTRAHQHFTDFILDVETRLIGGTDYNWHEVSCRFVDDENSYSFAIGADGTYVIAKWVDDNETYFVTSAYSSHVNQGVNAINLIHIECIGSSLSLSVNGHLLWEGTDTTFSGGDIALAAHALAGTSTEVAFDNIVVSEP